MERWGIQLVACIVEEFTRNCFVPQGNFIIAIKNCSKANAVKTAIKEGKNIKVSRLSYGIPIGADIDYLDPLTITRAMDDRKFLS